MKLTRDNKTKYTLIIESNTPRGILDALGLAFDTDLDKLIDEAVEFEPIEPDPIKTDPIPEPVSEPVQNLPTFNEMKELAKKVKDYTGSSATIPNLLKEFKCAKLSDLKDDQKIPFMDKLNEMLNA